MVKGYIPLATARANQANALKTVISLLLDRVEAARSDSDLLKGPAPIFMGVGASYAATAAAVWTLRARGKASFRVNAGECPLPLPVGDHPVIGISQSGKSTETLAALNAVAREKRFSVVNVSRSPIAEASALAISLGDIPDSYASTIGYTATIAALGILAEAWDGGVIDQGWLALGDVVRDFEAALHQQIPQLIAPMIDALYADCAANASSVGSAEVGALLLREITRLPSSGLSTRQYLHGAMESAGRGIHILFGGEREHALARTLAHAGHDTILVSAAAIIPEKHLQHIRVPELSAAQQPILEAIIMQTLAVETALARGIDPDAFVFHHNDTKVA